MHKKTVRYIAYLAFLSAVSPLTTDMYLAAIPKIAEEWGVSTELITSSLTLWFVSFSIGLLLAGSLSDKFGRRPILLLGTGGFILSTLFCGLSVSPLMLIICRILQGLGASAPVAMSMAVCRDRFDGENRKIALAYIGIMLALAPILAPSLGSFLLWFADWRFIFYFQTVLGGLIMIFSLSFTETNRELLSAPLYRLLGRYLVLFKNKGYILTTLTLCMLSGPFYGNVAFSPIIYLQLNGLSNVEFSMFFALTACCTISGAFAFTRLNTRIADMKILTGCFIGVIIAGVVLFFFGASSYLVYFVCVSLIAFSVGMSRPLSNSLILGYVASDIGSASSFMIFYQFLFGSFCMSYASHKWEVLNPVLMFGVMAVGVSVVAFMFWLRVKKLPAGKN